MSLFGDRAADIRRTENRGQDFIAGDASLPPKGSLGIFVHLLQVLLRAHHPEQVAETFGCRCRLLEPQGNGGQKRRHRRLSLRWRQPELAAERANHFAAMRIV